MALSRADFVVLCLVDDGFALSFVDRHFGRSFHCHIDNYSFARVNVAQAKRAQVEYSIFAQHSKKRLIEKLFKTAEATFQCASLSICNW